MSQDEIIRADEVDVNVTDNTDLPAGWESRDCYWNRGLSDCWCRGRKAGVPNQ